jgi:hypothetical protein
MNDFIILRRITNHFKEEIGKDFSQKLSTPLIIIQSFSKKNQSIVSYSKLMPCYLLADVCYTLSSKHSETLSRFKARDERYFKFKKILRY